MATLLGPLVRHVYRRELIPVRVRWWLAAAGMRDWLRVLASRLRPHLGDRARPVLAALCAEMFARRYDALRQGRPALPPDLRAGPLLMAALYRVGGVGRGARLGGPHAAAWIFGAVGGPPAGLRERLRAHRLLGLLGAEERWQEVATHLGELLIVLTERLPDELPHARKVLGDICFQAGVRYAESVVRLLGLPGAPPPRPSAAGGTPCDAPAQAIEVLRMSEYIFHVNPRHFSASDAAARTGWLEGTACPWYRRPGWNGAHCGIFGQFQSGISSVFGLRYHLSQTIPKHGGDTCRIDLKPVPLRLRKED